MADVFISSVGQKDKPVPIKAPSQKFYVQPDIKEKISLPTTDKVLAISHAVQWGLIGATFCGVSPAYTAGIGATAKLISEFSTYAFLPKRMSWLRALITFPYLSRWVLDASPLLKQGTQALSLLLLVKNSFSKLFDVFKKAKKDPKNAVKAGTVHLFNLASGVAFAAESAGLIRLSPSQIADSQESKKETPNTNLNAETEKTKPTEPSLNKREIRLATVYDNQGDSRRQAISDLVTENHKKYAAHWNLKHDVVTESLVKGQCENPLTKETQNCSPYWNKVKYFKNWCETPQKSGVEEWAIYADDDAVYTNFQIDPSAAIDKLRDGKDASFIIATEGQGTRNNPGAVNTGVMIVRKDKQGCDVVDQIWKNRNTVTSLNPECPTYGVCKGQKNGDEQGATDKVLWSDSPKLVENEVQRILARDPTHPTRGNIAFNTLHRGGCFRALLPDGQLGGPFDISTHDRKVNPDGIWQEGDWIGQTGGYPMYGQDLSHQPADACKEDPSIPVGPIRLKKVQQLIFAADKTVDFDPRSLKPIKAMPKEEAPLQPNPTPLPKPIQTGAKARQITMGTAYDNSGEPNRNAISEFVNANHGDYAKKWGLNHQPISEKLVAGKCLDPQKRLPADCAPYWNKIEMLRQWLKEPKNPNVDEEWRIYVDDDMLVTNKQIDPYKAIDELRSGQDTSVIVAEDVINWQRWFFDQHNPHFSVNTGALIVRKDEKASEFIDAIWKLRNLPVKDPIPDCPTIGMCKQQDRSMHEQEALTRVLRAAPHLENDVITVVPPRDTSSSSRAHIAMNTFYRKGCFTRTLKGWASHPFTYETMDNAENPSGAFRKNDWLVQVAGVPVLGKDLPFTYGSCIDRSDVQETPVRLNKLKELSKQIV